MRDVILINTKTSEIVGKDSPLLPPLNILRIASILVERGYGVKIIDQRIEEDWKEELKKELQKGVICVGISSLSGMAIKFGLEASKICKDYNIKTVWGGVHPTKDPYTTINNKYVDFVIKGEGEISFYNLVEALKRGGKIDNIKGILFKVGDKINETPDCSPIDLNTLPKIPFDLLDLNKYKQKKNHLINLEGLILPLETSRGCPYSCRFCSNIHKGWRAITADKIIGELIYIRDNFTRNVMFVDENFFLDHKRIKKLFDLIKKEKIDMNFCANPRIDDISKDPDLLNELVACGFKTLFLSIDATSQRMLDLVNKQLKMSQILSVSRNFNKKRITVNYHMMTGFPHESTEDIKEGFLLAFKLLLENRNARAIISIFMPTPGIEVLNDCIKLGFKKPDALEEWSIYSTDFRSKSKFPWIKNEVQEFFKKFDYIQGLYNLRIFDFPFANQIIRLFSNLIKIRIKNNYYGFNVEQKIANMLRCFVRKYYTMVT